jgi:hypothetical protein
LRSVVLKVFLVDGTYELFRHYFGARRLGTDRAAKWGRCEEF